MAGKRGKANNVKKPHLTSADTSTKVGAITHKEQKFSGPIGSTCLVLIALSVVMATAAIVVTNEDIQMYLVNIIFMGANPLEYLVRSEDRQQTVIPDNVEKPAHTENVVEDKLETVKILTESETTERVKVNSAEHETVQDVKNVKEENAKGVKDVKKDNAEGVKYVKEENAEEIKNVKEETATTVKKKTKRDNYAKSDITNKADFKIRTKLDAADELLEKNDVVRASQMFDDLIKEHPDSARALFGKGLALDKLAEQQRSNQLLEEAINTMDRALRLPGTPEKLVIVIAEKLADRQSFRGWSHKEPATWRFVIQKYPDNVEFRRKYGVSFLKSGKNDLARDVFKQILEKEPNDGFSKVHLGFILKVNDLNYNEAIPLMQSGIDSGAPGTVDGRFFYHLGDAYSRINQTDKAREVYRKGAQLGLFLSEHQRSLYNADSRITGRPWWTPQQTTYQKYLTLLENNWQTIRDEGLAQLNKKTGSFLPEEENLRETGDWQQFTLYQRGKKDEENCKKVPKTCTLLDQIPEAKGCKRGQIKFSVMHPGVHVWPHTGPTNCRIRAHLGLIVPEGPRIRVGNDTRTWTEGKFIIFDDSFEHEVWHNGTELRLVLIVDFWHPELSDYEKRTLAPI